MYPNATAPAHLQQYSFGQTAGLAKQALSRLENICQVEAWARVALEGARHKRGPPAVRLS